MHLAIDIGNTAAKLGAFKGEELLEVAYTNNNTLAALPEMAKRYPIKSAIYSTTVDLSDEAMEKIAQLPFPCLKMTSTTPIPITCAYEQPETLGTDRIAAVVGAASIKQGVPLLVIDSGTCITFEFLDEHGCYQGGNISPGLEMRLKALNHFTSRLPLVMSTGPMPELGKDTKTAIRLGVKKGLQYEIEGYIEEFRRKYPNLLVFLTGGDDFSFDTNIKNLIFADRFLVLKGLNRILNYNNDKK